MPVNDEQGKAFCMEEIPFSDEDSELYSREAEFCETDELRAKWDAMSNSPYCDSCEEPASFSGREQNKYATSYGNYQTEESRARVYLNVPYAEKDEAKKYGAKWDSSKRKWYVPGGVSPDPFQKWMN